ACHGVASGAGSRSYAAFGILFFIRFLVAFLHGHAIVNAWFSRKLGSDGIIALDRSFHFYKLVESSRADLACNILMSLNDVAHIGSRRGLDLKQSILCFASHDDKHDSECDEHEADDDKNHGWSLICCSCSLGILPRASKKNN